MRPAVIKDAKVAAAHEGIAELIVSIEHDNGGVSEVALDQAAASALMRACRATTLEDVKGHPWERVRDALQVSYNRYRQKAEDYA